MQRYKGLGEMNAEQLADTTMNPEKRTLLQVRLEDAVKSEEIFSTLMGEDVESRAQIHRRERARREEPGQSRLDADSDATARTAARTSSSSISMSRVVVR